MIKKKEEEEEEETKKKNNDDDNDMNNRGKVEQPGLGSKAERFTFIIKMRVLSAMNDMMRYSKMAESTNRHTRYCHVFGSSGMKRSLGLATMAKCRQSRCMMGRKTRTG